MESSVRTETTLRTILDELRELRELVERGESPGPTPHADDLVDCDYIARRTGLSPRTVRDGKAGTNAIPRALLNGSGKRSLVRFYRADADRFIRDLSTELPAREHALRRLNRRTRRFA
jgi:hypothetical protein